MINNILILGSLPQNEEENNFYNSIIGVCKEFTNNISSPIDTSNFKGTDKERFKRASKKIKEADLIIAELSNPSTGAGIEIGQATNLDIPLIVIAKKESKVSGLIKGNPILKEIIYYDEIDELEIKLKKTISQHNSSQNI